MKNSYLALFLLCLSYIAVFSLASLTSVWYWKCLIEIAALILPFLLSRKLLILKATPRDYDIGFSVRPLLPSLCLLPFFVGGVVLISTVTGKLAELAGNASTYDYGDSVWICLLTSALLPAITEELFCRYLFLPRLTVYSRGGAILASAIFFSLLHGNFVQIPYAFFAGLVLGALAVGCGSVIPGIVFHFVNNTASILLHFYQDTPLPRILLIVLLVAMAAGLVGIFLMRRQYAARLRYICSSDGEEPQTVGRVIGGMFTSPLAILLLLFIVEAFLEL